MRGDPVELESPVTASGSCGAWIRGRLALLAGLGVVLTLLAAPAAQASDPGYSWQSGPLVESQDFNCITGDIEQEAGSFMSYYFDPATPPVAGQPYYVAIDVTAIGNTCPGIYGDVELKLPAGTSLAIDSSHPVQCLLLFPGASSYVNDPEDCPQSLSLGTYGYSLDPIATTPPFWPLPLGGTVEVNVPVESVAGVNKIAGVVQLADGEYNPVLEPYIDTIVDSAGQQPSGTNGEVNSEVSVSYANPSITSQTTNTNKSVNVSPLGYVWNQSAVGTAYAQLAYPSAPGTTPPANCASPYNSGSSTNGGYLLDLSASLRSPDTQISGAFTSLYPGTPYCWRIVAVVTSPAAAAGTYDGNWQFFETQGTPLGTGSPYYAPFGTAAPATGTSDCSTSGGGCSTSSCGLNGACTSCDLACAEGFSSAFTPSAPSVTSTPTPTPAPAPTPAPTVTGSTQSHGNWREGNALAQISKAKPKSKGPPVGTTFKFSLNEAAAVTFSFDQSVTGRKVAGKCVAKTKQNGKSKHCARIVTAGTLSFAGHDGTNTVVFDGRVSASQKLKPGAYTLVIAATNAQAGVATPASLHFKIVR